MGALIAAPNGTGLAARALGAAPWDRFAPRGGKKFRRGSFREPNERLVDLAPGALCGRRIRGVGAMRAADAPPKEDGGPSAAAGTHFVRACGRAAIRRGSARDGTSPCCLRQWLSSAAFLEMVRVPFLNASWGFASNRARAWSSQSAT